MIAYLALAFGLSGLVFGLLAIVWCRALTKEMVAVHELAMKAASVTAETTSTVSDLARQFADAVGAAASAVQSADAMRESFTKNLPTIIQSNLTIGENQTTILRDLRTITTRYEEMAGMVEIITRKIKEDVSGRLDA